MIIIYLLLAYLGVTVAWNLIIFIATQINGEPKRNKKWK